MLENILVRKPLTRCFITWCLMCLSNALANLFANLQILSPRFPLIFPFSILVLFIVAPLGSKNLTVKFPLTFFVKSPGRWWTMKTDLSLQFFRCSFCGSVTKSKSCCSCICKSEPATKAGLICKSKVATGLLESESRREIKMTHLSPTRGMAILNSERVF